MSDHNEQVEPVAFDTADSPVAPQQNRSGPIVPPPAAPQPTPKWVFPALGGLLLLAVVVVFWLPGKVEITPEPPATEAPTTAGTASLHLAHKKDPHPNEEQHRKPTNEDI